MNPNQLMINNLFRQKESIDNLINQYSQPPVQNIINTNASEIEARIIGVNDDISNIAVTRKTVFVDESRKKVTIKEVDGTISKEYEIIVPLDEKDKKILELENRLKEMEERINVQYAKLNKSNDVEQQSVTVSNKPVESESKTISKPISRTK